MSKYNLLIVEDEKDYRETLKQVLEIENYQVDQAKNGVEALEMWEKNIYHLILTDLRMSEGDGKKLIQEIKKRQPFAQIIILSGQGKAEDLLTAVNEHVYAYIDKSQKDNQGGSKDKFDEIIDKVRKSLKDRDPIILNFEQMAEKIPDRPYLIVGEKSYTAKELYEEVWKRTDFGKEYYERYKKSMTEFVDIPEEELKDLLGIEEEK